MRVTPTLARRLSGRRRIMLAAAVLPAVLFAASIVLLPPPDPGAALPAPGAVLLDRHGAVLQRDERAGLRIPVRLDEVAPLLAAATVAAEDQRFDVHPGVDPLAMARAVVNLLHGERSGASTITQQLARTLYLADTGEPLPLRKAHESWLAMRLEAHYSKDEILEMYLGATYYGRGAYGAEAAARVYFGVRAFDLDLAQAAFLAGLPQSPAVYGEAPSAARARQAYVLQRMADTGAVSATAANAARSEALRLLPARPEPIAPHFAAYALDELARLRPDLAGRAGLVIETTLDAGLQAETTRLARLKVAELGERGVGNAAAVVLEPGSGRVLAMLGSVDPSAPGGLYDMALQPRQPGSALKPFLYAAAFERGESPATPVLDVPTTFDTREGPYSPENYDRRYHGVVPVRVALASSYNIPAVRTLHDIGVDAFLEIAHRFGLATLTDAEAYGLSLTLGGGDVRLLDLTAAYAAIANEGVFAAPYAIERVRDASGRVLFEHQRAPGARVLQAEYAYQVADILADPQARVPGFGEGSVLELPFPAAVKTGTTTGSRDNWALGFTPDVAVGVWVGNTDSRPMQDVTGITGAGPIWRGLMLTAAQGRGWLPLPPGLVTSPVCTPTGLLPGRDCPFVVSDLFLRGREPRAEERYYARAPGGGLVVSPPLEARPWAAQAGLALADSPRTGGGGEAVQVVQPVPGAVLYLSPELPAQQVLLRAATPPGTEKVQFRVDGQLAGEAPADSGAVTWRLEPGPHRIEAVAVLRDGRTTSTTSTYEVRLR